MSPQAPKPAGVIPKPSVRRFAKTKKKPAMWRAWSYARIREDDAKLTNVEGTSTKSGEEGRAEAIARFEAKAKKLLPQPLNTVPTVKDMAEEWLGWAKHRESTRATYRSVLNTSLSSVHERPVSEVTSGELYDLLMSLSPGSVDSAYALLRGAFSRSVALNLVPRSPVTKDIKPQKHEDSAQVLRRLTLAEVQELRERFRKAEARPRSSLPIFEVTELMLRTGARIGEVLALRVRDVQREVDIFADPPTAVTLVSITGTQVSSSRLLRQEHTKTGANGQRMVQVSERFYTEHLAPLMNGKTPDGWLFEARRLEGRDGPQMVAAANLRRLWRELIADTPFAGAEVTPHTYRRTVAQALVDAKQVELATALLGHTTARTLFRSYADRPIPIVSPSELLDDILWSIVAPKRRQIGPNCTRASRTDSAGRNREEPE